LVNALDESPSLIQLEKESGVDLLNPSNKIIEAVSVYYSSIINYTLENIIYELNKYYDESIKSVDKDFLQVPVYIDSPLTVFGKQKIF